MIKLVFDEDATFTDPQLAGQRLGSLLASGPRRLLVLDDVWETGQLAPFIEGGMNCARLVTTRVPELLAGQGTAVQVDQMSPDQAGALLTAGLPPLDETVAAGLLEVTGRWPLLLRLVNKILADYAGLATDVSAKGTVLGERLRERGPAVVDDLLGVTARGLDVSQPADRARAVRATIGASTSLLDSWDAERFTELSVFAEDETIPFGLAARLWRATAGLDDLQAAQLCNRLAQLALISQAAGAGHGLTLHDVVRDFLRAEIGGQRLAALHGVLVDAAAANLATPKLPDSAGGHMVRAAWWQLEREDRYLWDHLIEHLRGAGRPGEADAVACDLRWVGARLERFGPAAPAADLAAADTPRADRLRAVLARVAHLLTPTEPPGAVVDVLHSRVALDSDWGPQVTALRDVYPRPRLVNRWLPPDLADPALRRVLVGCSGAVAVAPDGSWLALACGGGVRIYDAVTGQQRAILAGHSYALWAVAIAPDGSWLASGGEDRTVRIWDPVTGQHRAVLTGHARRVQAVAIAPDGSWLASAAEDETVRICDAATGRKRAVLTGHTGPVRAVAIAPDGSWLASAGDDQTVRIWDAVTGRQRTVLTGHTRRVQAVAIAPDGSWLASAAEDQTVRIWDAATGQQRAVLTGHTGSVEAVGIAPDGSWLASAGNYGAVRIWDAGTGQQRAVLTGHTSVEALAVAPDGSWLASAGGHEVRIWDAATGQRPAVLSADTGWRSAVAAAPDGSCLASGGEDQTVRIWDAATGQQRAVLTGHTDRVGAVAVAPDGTWLASASGDKTVRIWDAATWQQRAVLTGQTGWVAAVAIAPDGSWLASAGDDETVRIWDAATGQQRAVLAHHAWPARAMAVVPDGSWLAAASGGEVRIWDAATRQQRAVLTGHTGQVEALAVAPDGHWLASVGEDQTVRIWDAATWQQRAIMRFDTMVSASAWLGAGTLAVGGKAGLYLFDFVTDTGAATAGIDKPATGESIH